MHQNDSLPMAWKTDNRRRQSERGGWREDWQSLRRARAVPKLAVGVFAPAEHVSTRADGAAMLLPTGQMFEIG